jgi:hypothetical protein
MVQEEFAKFIELYAPPVLEGVLESLLHRCDSYQFMWPARTYAAPLAARIRELIEAKRPASLIRLGDGEGNVLGALDPCFPALAADSMGRIMNLMFGRQPRGQTEVSDLQLGMVAAVEQADIIGIPDGLRLKGVERQIKASGERGEYDTRGISGTANAVRYTQALLNAAPPERKPILTNCYCHRDLLPYYRDLLSGIDVVGLISCFPELPDRLKRHFSVNRVDFYQIPDQASNRRPPGSSAQQPSAVSHYPERFTELMESLQISYHGQVFLVAAGILGKMYCTRLKLLGAIAIDIGSIADVWMDEAVRAYHDSDFIGRWRL